MSSFRFALRNIIEMTQVNAFMNTGRNTVSGRPRPDVWGSNFLATAVFTPFVWSHFRNQTQRWRCVVVMATYLFVSLANHGSGLHWSSLKHDLMDGTGSSYTDLKDH